MLRISVARPPQLSTGSFNPLTIQNRANYPLELIACFVSRFRLGGKWF